MKKQYHLPVILIGLALQACSNGDASKTSEVKIGNQVWMASNLNTDRFRNGDQIPEVTSIEEWSKAGEEGKPAFCYYKNDSLNGQTLGKLYNWYAVNDSRGLAPEGWKIPSDSDWKELETSLGGEAIAGNSLKSSKMWAKLEDGKSGTGSNESGFNALPGGFRFYFGEYNAGSYGYWWTSTETSSTSAWGRYMNSASLASNRSVGLKAYGFSVRCVRQ